MRHSFFNCALLVFCAIYYRYHIPLKAILLNKDLVIVEPEWLNRPPMEETPRSSNLFEWPEVLAAAMHSVLCDMNRNPQPVRVYAASDAELIIDRELFSKAVSHYYTSFLPTLSVNELKRVASRKVGFNGTAVSLGDGKINHIIRLNYIVNINIIIFVNS